MYVSQCACGYAQLLCAVLVYLYSAGVSVIKDGFFFFTFAFLPAPFGTLDRLFLLLTHSLVYSS